MSDPITAARELLSARDRTAAVGVGYADRALADALRAVLDHLDRPALCWTPARGGSGWLLCGTSLRDGRILPNTDDLRGMIFDGPESGFCAVAHYPNTLERWGKRRKAKSMDGARRSLAKILGVEIPALPLGAGDV